MANLSALDVVIYGHNRNLMRLQQVALRAFNIRHIEPISRPSALEDLLLYSPKDIIILNHVCGVDLGEVVSIVRDQTVSQNPFAVIIVVTPAPTRSVITEALNLGVDGVIALPFTGGDFWKQLVYFVNNTRTFLRTDSYFGPCRRRTRGLIYSGIERRDMIDGDPKSVKTIPGVRRV